MIDKQFGITRRPLEIYEDHIETLFGDDDSADIREWDKS